MSDIMKRATNEPEIGSELLGTWKFDNNIESATNLHEYFNINFISNNKNFNTISLLFNLTRVPDNSMNYNGKTVWSNFNGWVDEAYKTITITDASNLTNIEEFTTWLKNNATKQKEQTPKAISLDNLKTFKKLCDNSYINQKPNLEVEFNLTNQESEFLFNDFDGEVKRDIPQTITNVSLDDIVKVNVNFQLGRVSQKLEIYFKLITKMLSEKEESIYSFMHYVNNFSSIFVGIRFEFIENKMYFSWRFNTRGNIDTNGTKDISKYIRPYVNEKHLEVYLEIPKATTENNNKILQVVDGAYELVNIPNGNEDELLGTWKFNDNLTNISRNTSYGNNIEFKSNNYTYKNFYISYLSDGYSLIYDTEYEGDYLSGNSNTTNYVDLETPLENDSKRFVTLWYNEAYKTITITDTSNLTNIEEFTTWLKNNATKQKDYYTREELEDKLLTTYTITLTKEQETLFNQNKIVTIENITNLNNYKALKLVVGNKNFTMLKAVTNTNALEYNYNIVNGNVILSISAQLLGTRLNISKSQKIFISIDEKGSANGVASLDGSGKVPSSQLPSYVDDVLEYANKTVFPATGEAGKIYVSTNDNKTYRWSGSTYVEISSSLALGETSSTAYPGNKGKANADKIAELEADVNQNIADISGKQDKLVSGTSIKTINGQSLLGSGDITIEASSGTVEAITQEELEDILV